MVYSAVHRPAAQPFQVGPVIGLLGRPSGMPSAVEGPPELQRPYFLSVPCIRYPVQAADSQAVPQTKTVQEPPPHPGVVGPDGLGRPRGGAAVLARAMLSRAGARLEVGPEAAPAHGYTSVVVLHGTEDGTPKNYCRATPSHSAPPYMNGGQYLYWAECPRCSLAWRIFRGKTDDVSDHKKWDCAAVQGRACPGAWHAWIAGAWVESGLSVAPCTSGAVCNDRLIDAVWARSVIIAVSILGPCLATSAALRRDRALSDGYYRAAWRKHPVYLCQGVAAVVAAAGRPLASVAVVTAVGAVAAVTAAAAVAAVGAVAAVTAPVVVVELPRKLPWHLNIWDGVMAAATTSAAECLEYSKSLPLAEIIKTVAPFLLCPLKD